MAKALKLFRNQQFVVVSGWFEGAEVKISAIKNNGGGVQRRTQ